MIPLREVDVCAARVTANRNNKVKQTDARRFIIDSLELGSYDCRTKRANPYRKIPAWADQFSAIRLSAINRPGRARTRAQGLAHCFRLQMISSAVFPDLCSTTDDIELD